MANGGVTDSPKRRCQFSLRWLIVVVTLLCPLFARSAYFRERALFHEREAAKYEQLTSGPGIASADDIVPRVRAYEHRYLAYRYRRAMYRPLTVIFEPTLPWQERNETNIGLF